MDQSLEAIARLRMEAEFGTHAHEVANAGWLPTQALQLGLQEVVPSTPRQRPNYRPELGDPSAYLQAIYNAQQ